MADIIIKSSITTLIHKKDDIEFVTEFPCFWTPAVSVNHSLIEQ